MAELKFKVYEVRPDLAPHPEKSIESVPHVQTVTVDLDTSTVTVRHDGADAKEIAAAIREEGFEPRSV